MEVVGKAVILIEELPSDDLVCTRVPWEKTEANEAEEEEEEVEEEGEVSKVEEGGVVCLGLPAVVALFSVIEERSGAEVNGEDDLAKDVVRVEDPVSLEVERSETNADDASPVGDTAVDGEGSGELTV